MSNSAADRPVPPAPSRPRAVDPAGALFGIAIPLLAAASGLLLTWLRSPRLPEPIAVHWSGGTPDGFGSAWSTATTMAIVLVLVGCGCSAFAALAGAQLMTRRAMLLIGLGVVGLLTAAWITLLWAQLDLADAADARMPMSALAAGMVAGLAVGALGAVLLRDHRERSAADAPPDPDLPRGPVELPIVDQLGLSTAAAVCWALGGAAVTVLLCRLADSWWLFPVFGAAGLLSLSLLRYRVTVDETGLRVRNMGMTTMAYGVEELIGARVDEVKPFRDFGGWGLRVKGRGNYAVATRSGPAVVFTAANGQRLTVTSARAAEMAGALNALADKRF
ncbi:DUF1648 domain-containing protein [Rhodococcus kronopolitis]|uniref:DUF1648 domain-containing protein n=1 Tax=Rhodococcus kronopolitis TaxID=1460226 RepID=A0ABV9FP90_9NOCA